MSIYYEDDFVELHHSDWRDVLIGDDPADPAAIVTDPPYGIGFHADGTKYSGGGTKWDDAIHGDDGPFDPTPFLRYERVVMWGFPHFASMLPRGSTLVWIKKRDQHFGKFMSDCDLAWMKGGYGVYAFRHIFSPKLRAEEAGMPTAHPMQKPVALMRWCIEQTKLPQNGIVIDPFCGSGSTLVAARDMGIKALGCEVNEQFCENAARRLSMPRQALL